MFGMCVRAFVWNMGTDWQGGGKKKQPAKPRRNIWASASPTVSSARCMCQACRGINKLHTSHWRRLPTPAVHCCEQRARPRSYFPSVWPTERSAVLGRKPKPKPAKRWIGAACRTHELMITHAAVFRRQTRSTIKSNSGWGHSLIGVGSSLLPGCFLRRAGRLCSAAVVGVHW